MRVIDSIPHESMTISIFQFNDKFVVRFEAGPMEQSFKFLISGIGSVEKLKELINVSFIEDTRKRFNEMFVQMRNLGV